MRAECSAGPRAPSVRGVHGHITSLVLGRTPARTGIVPSAINVLPEPARPSDSLWSVRCLNSPEEVLQSAQQHHPRVGIATVYRNIQTLVEEGWLQPVEVPGDATRYEVAGKKHHHHFQCNECGKLYDLEGCAAQSRPKLPRGFRASGHEFYVYGTCAACIPAK